MYAFVKSIRNAEHVQRFTIEPTPAGWEVREEHDSQVVRQRYFQDWHRVERARRELVLRLSALKERGWVEAGN
jgi:hypothetical protein